MAELDEQIAYQDEEIHNLHQQLQEVENNSLETENENDSSRLVT